MLMLAMALPGAARALGLGEIRVDSQLNEPLSAQIDIVGATRDDLAALTAKVAGRDIFQRYGADRPSFLSSATFKVGLDAKGRPVLNIRSTDAFTDPVIEFLVDINWGKGELIREYSLLLDPPGFATAAPTTEFAAAGAAAAVRAASAATPPSNPAPFSDRAPASNPAAAAVPTRVANTPDAALAANAALAASAGLAANAALAASAGTARAASAAPAATAPAVAATDTWLRVAAGDTLRGIARRAGTRSEAEAQRLMIAIFRANPHAFEGNINLLRRGALLRIPSDLELDAINTAVATSEVRAQTTAWRQDARSAARHPDAAMAKSGVSARSPPARVKSPDEALRLRVQALEQTLDATNRELAAKDAKVQDLKQLAAEPAIASPAAPPPTPAAAAAQPSPGPAPVPAAGSPLHAELMQSQAHPAPLPPVLAPAKAPPAMSLVNETQLASIAAALAIMLAGFAYVRRRLARGGADLPALVNVPPETAAIERREPREPGQLPALPVLPSLALDAKLLEHPAAAVVPDPTADTAPLAILSAAPDAATPAPPAVPAAALDARHAAALASQEPPTHAPGHDIDSEIDTQALERSYLEGLATDAMAVDTATHEAVPYDMANHDALPHDTGSHGALPHDTATQRAMPYDAATYGTMAYGDTASHKAVPYESASDGTVPHASSAPAAGAHDVSDAMYASSELPTRMMQGLKTDSHRTDLAPLDSADLDHDLLALDATAHHVRLSGNLHDPASAVERRMNLVDVLKSAIERDPHRRDLVVKLLETYYGAVSANQRAFLDVVRKLPRELNFLTKEDWRKVEAMGRDIAPHDPLFVADIKGDLLPNFA
jgi:FimV-like protein